MIKDLPNDIKKALGDPSNFQKVCKIANSFGISANGMGERKLDEIFEKVLKGNLPSKNIAQEIRKQFGFSEELSQDITKEMQAQIFSNYKESLDKLYLIGKPLPPSPKVPEKEKKEAEIEKAEEKAEYKFPQLKISSENNSLEKEIVKESTKEGSEELPEDKPVTRGKDKVSSILEDLSKELDAARKAEKKLNKEVEDSKKEI